MPRQGNSKEAIQAYLLLTPTLGGFLVFGLVPIIASLFLSFTEWDLFSSPRWVGLQNFIEIFQDDMVCHSLRNTLIFVLLNVPIAGVLLPLPLAVLLNRNIRGVNLLRTIYFMPVVTLSVSAGFVWNWMYNPEFGIINYLLSIIGISGKKWLLSPQTALVSLVIVNAWKWVGYNLVIFLAALQGIPHIYYEAAWVEGASSWMTFWKITLPLLMPTIFFVTVVGIIGSLQFFDLVYIMTQGGPGDATMVYNYYIYQNAFRFSRMGYAAALAWVLFVLVFLATMVQFRLARGRVSYDY